MTILVTGGAGFIGSHIVDAYIKAKHHVIVVDDLSSGNKAYVHPDAVFYKRDISEEDVSDIFEKHAIEVINHHAAQKSVSHSVREPAFDAHVNILGMLKLLEQAKKHAVKKFIFASTGGALYGNAEDIPTTESAAIVPMSPYGIAKHACEHYVRVMSELAQMQSVVFRYANVYGPRQDAYGEAGVIALFTRQMLANEQPQIHGDGDQTRDFVYVDDVVDANLAALSDNLDCPPVNISTGVETSINELYAHIASAIGYDKDAVHVEGQVGAVARSCLSFEEAKTCMQWEPKVSLKEGIAKTIEWFKSQR